MTNLTVFQDYYGSLDCIDYMASALVEKSVRLIAFEESEPDGRTGGAVTQLDDGRFATFNEAQDYTGHGCQCHSEAMGPFDTLEDACMLGLDENLRDLLRSELAAAGFHDE